MFLTRGALAEELLWWIRMSHLKSRISSESNCHKIVKGFIFGGESKFGI